MNESKTILVVEDDAVFRRLITRTLKTQGYQTREAENGMIAKTMFTLGEDQFCLILSDVKMPTMDGLTLLRDIRAVSKVPFILMTGFSEILEAQRAGQEGANGFLPKPFRADSLFSTIETALNPQTLNQGSGAPLTFCQIHIAEFVSRSHLVSDLYVRLGEHRYVKVAHKGDEVPVDRLKVYEEKKVDYVYVTSEDFASYVNFNIHVTQKALDSSKISKPTKIKLLKHATESIIEQCYVDGVEESALRPAQKFIEDTLELATEDRDLAEVLNALQTHSSPLYAHSVAVSFFACLVAKEHGWHASATLFKVSLGGLLHDIGKKEVPANIITKPRVRLSTEELKLLETHPLRGREILAALPSLPEDIAIIVAQHHESPFGSGYPLKLKSEQIHQVAKLIHTVDRFVHLILPLNDDTLKLEPKEALERMKKYYSDELDRGFLASLLRVFKVDQKSRVA